MALFTAYFDESGTDDGNDFVAVGGLLADAEHWQAFECRWREILKEYDVPYSHMKEFAHSNGVFNKWKSATKEFEDQRRGFLGKLCDTTVEYSAHSFGFIVSKLLYEACVPPYMREEMGGPYTFLSRYCLAAIGLWAKDNDQSEPINAIFERGQPQHALTFQHDLLRAREEMRREFRIGALDFAEKYDKECPSRTVLPLQSADLVAYELFKNETDRRYRIPFRQREPIRRLKKIPHRWNKIELINIIEEVEAWKRGKRSARALPMQDAL